MAITQVPTLKGTSIYSIFKQTKTGRQIEIALSLSLLSFLNMQIGSLQNFQILLLLHLHLTSRGLGLKVVPRLHQAEVVSKSSNKSHQTWGPPFSQFVTPSPSHCRRPMCVDPRLAGWPRGRVSLSLSAIDLGGARNSINFRPGIYLGSQQVQAASDAFFLHFQRSQSSCLFLKRSAQIDK